MATTEELEAGEIRCKYCRKPVLEKEAVERNIINFRMYGRGGRTFKYCSDQCGLHDQFAHEG